MEGVIEEYIHSHTVHKVPFTADKLRYFWTKNLLVEEEYTDFLSTMKEQDIFEDPAAVMAAFRESFTDDSYASRFNRFMSIVWKPGQTFQVFVNQFRKYAAALDLEDDKMGVRAFLAQRFLLCLPAEYNMSHIMTEYVDAPPFTQLIKAAAQQTSSQHRTSGPGKLYHVNQSLKRCFAAGDVVHANVSGGATPSVSHSNNGKRHGNGGGPIHHEKKRFVPKSSLMDKPLASWCFRCNGDGHYSHKCANKEDYPIHNKFKLLPNGDRPTGSEREHKSFAHVRLIPGSSDSSPETNHSSFSSTFHLSQFDNEELTSLKESIMLNKEEILPYLSPSVLRVVRLIPSNNSSIKFSVLIEDRPYIAIVDTGSTITCISTRVMNDLDIMMIPAIDDDAPIQLANAEATVPRIGCTPTISINAENKIVSHSCEVMDLPSDYDVLIGMDTFFKFGLGISGLPIGRALPSSVPSITENSRPPRTPATPAEIEATPEFMTMRDKFMAAIQPLLDENAAIPRDSFCTLPESVVDLPTTPGKSTYIRQYPIPVK
jgi:hypothetical protein